MTSQITPASDNLFLDLGFEPEEAENLRLRSELMVKLRIVLETKGITQGEAATLLNVTQPRVSDLVRGKLHRFSVESLVAMLHRVGMTVSVIAEPVSASPSGDISMFSATTADGTDLADIHQFILGTVRHLQTEYTQAAIAGASTTGAGGGMVDPRMAATPAPITCEPLFECAA